jgi:hypothetical protein
MPGSPPKPFFLVGKPLLECLQQRIAQAWLDGRWSGERGDAQILNATEFVEMEVEDQGDDDLQIEFAIGNANKVISPLVFNSCSERLQVATVLTRRGRIEDFEGRVEVDDEFAHQSS